MPSSVDPKLIAFFLPQFHPIPENDHWWGKGFTEWHNVVKSRPLFPGHYQPHLPADLGFYDLRLDEARHEQISLAKKYGIDGFCYHYYWFSGKRLLNSPIDNMVVDPKSDMPYCFCWANENWTRKWDGAEHEILIAQQHNSGDDLAFIKQMAEYFADLRYIRVDGAPILIVYQPQDLLDPSRTVGVWRDYCHNVGIGNIHLCAALTHGNDDYKQFGFDSGVQFPPHNIEFDFINDHIAFYDRHQGYAADYRQLVHLHLNREYASPNVYLTVSPSWDNTPRVGSRSKFFVNSSPRNYQFWLSRAIKKSREDYPEEQRLVFINAWNEWAESCHLEPDQRYGHQFLEATRSAKLNPDIAPAMEETLEIQPEQPSLRSELKRIVLQHLSRSLFCCRRYLKQCTPLYVLARSCRRLLARRSI